MREILMQDQAKNCFDKIFKKVPTLCISKNMLMRVVKKWT